MERHFPSHLRRRTHWVLAAVVAVVALLGTAVAVPMAQADDLKDKHNKVKKHIDRAEAHAEESSARLTKAMARVKKSRSTLYAAQGRFRATRKQLNQARALDVKMRAKLARAQARLTQAKADLKAAKQAVVDQRTDIGLMAASNYQNGDPKLQQLVVVLKTQSPSDMVTQMQAVDNLMGREEVTLDSLQVKRDQLADHERKVEAAKEQVAQRRAETRANVVRKRALNKQARKEKNQVLRLVRKREKATQHAQAVRRADLRRLRALKRQERKILAAIQAQSEQQGGGGYSGNPGGVLSRPHSGPVTSPFGWRKHPIYGYWGLHNGTDFGTGCGSPLHAARGGRVAAQYYDSVYGNRVYIDVGRVNGKSMTLIYNHLSQYRLKVGQRVRRGTVVGLSGTTGWSTGCHLHFTVTMNGEPVNPLKFM